MTNMMDYSTQKENKINFTFEFIGRNTEELASLFVAVFG